MKIYVNENYEILSINNILDNFTFVFNTEQTRGELFGELCDTCIQGYKFQPQYEMLFKEDGSNARDEKTGELLYKLDENGEKIPAGYACYPFVDHKMLMLIQKQYEDSQQKVQALNAQIEYLSMMSGIETEVDHE